MIFLSNQIENFSKENKTRKKSKTREGFDNENSPAFQREKAANVDVLSGIDKKFRRVHSQKRKENRKNYRNAMHHSSTLNMTGGYGHGMN